uniref:(California timema) hypothetical protein n=1 Tax=Timema californicum TaxID=61474 RepID=A0A7R9JD80_TIMCA|nr:unnamed protein product [Timema californicum]
MWRLFKFPEVLKGGVKVDIIGRQQSGNTIKICWRYTGCRAGAGSHKGDTKNSIKEKVNMIGGDVTLYSSTFGTKTKMSLKMSPDSYGNKGMTLEQFMKKVADAKSFGVKLNFEKINAFEETIKVLKAMSGKIKFPLWLNAVTDDMEDKDINKFLSLCTHNFPKATISIGMLHKGQTLGSKRGYSAKLVTQIKDTLTRNNVTQPVAFPVIAPIAADSLDTLPALKDVHGITDSALYMYDERLVNYSYDYINKMKKLVNIFGKNRVYLDSYADLAYYFSMTPYKSG